MSLAAPEASGTLLDGIKIGFVDSGEAIGDASDLKWFATLTGINGFGLVRATQPNLHNGVTTTAGDNVCGYLISQIRMQKEFTIGAVFAIGMTFLNIVKKTSGKNIAFEIPPEDGYVSGEKFDGPAECSEITLVGNMGGRVEVTIKVTPKGLFTQTAAVAA